jgi:uncharacterized protein YdbL (DUF1318 family)
MSGRAYAIAAAALLASPAASQPMQLYAALAAGQVGERYDGYLGFATPPSAEVRRQVDAVNIRRRSLYSELAVRRNVTASVVGLTTGCSLLAELPVGEAYMLKDGIWRRRGPGEPPPLPDYCR